MAVIEVAKAVEFEYQGQWPEFETMDVNDLDFEAGIAVKYDFEALLGNAVLKNVLLEAADTHLDMWVHQTVLCGRLEDIRSSLAGLGP